MKISVVVTNWNGLPLLKKYFEEIVKTSPEAEEIIFADDASEDNSVAYIKSLQTKYPKIKIIASKKNNGFGINTNQAVKRATGKLIVLLNNDIKPQPNYITNCLKHFQNPKVFGVGFAELGHECWARIYWSNGYLQHEPGKNTGKTHISAWVSGGSAIIRKEYFEKLGGFDPIYSPFYSEDLDLGLRAWKSGYQLLWEPKAIVEHKHESTMSKFPKRFLNYVQERNRLLSTIRNFTEPKFVYLNRLGQLGRILSGPNYIKIIRAAKKQIATNPPPIVFPIISSQQLLDLFK
ncbi:MAG TPA: glycosyltransferase family 2 protein [Candidatus Woesebacteria bacterium]|nr:glycosyltransferase family 2 protein [Candidatus Woesebacteria bacterium]